MGKLSKKKRQAAREHQKFINGRKTGLRRIKQDAKTKMSQALDKLIEREEPEKHTYDIQVVNGSIVINNPHKLSLPQCHHAKVECKDVVANIERFSGEYLRIPKVTSRNASKAIREICRQAFEKYRTPYLFHTLMYAPISPPFKVRETIVYVNIARGANIRKELADMVALSKKAAHILSTMSARIHFVGGARRAQVLSVGGGVALAQALNNGPWGSLQEWWKEELLPTVIDWMVRVKISGTNIGSVVDFFNMKYLEEQYITQTKFSLRGRTLKGMLREVEAWHRDLTNERAVGAISDQDFKVSTEAQPGVFVTGKKPHQIRYNVMQILSGKDLLNEGRKNKHCVVAYAGAIKRNECEIWSVRYLSVLKAGTVRVTVQLSDRKVVQVRGSRNRLPSSKEKSVILGWAKKNNLYYNPNYRGW